VIIASRNSLNRFLIRFALQSQLQTYLAFSDDDVFGS